MTGVPGADDRTAKPAGAGRVATNELVGILQSELDQASRNHRLRDLAKIRRGSVQVKAGRARRD